jgi:hypothetical protein
MNPILGWGLAAALLAVAWQAYGWQGVLAAISAIVFWLLLQFNRAVRVMKNAGATPVGHVDSAVMLNAKLHAGMTMLQVVTLTKSLGRKRDAAGGTWAWGDAGGNEVTLHFERGRLARFEFARGAGAEPAPAGAAPPAP